MNRVVHALLLAALPVFSLLPLVVPSTAAASSLDEFRDVMARGSHTLVANIENDSMLLKRDDGLFTSGMNFRSAWTLMEGPQARTWDWHIGQDLYTASDINLRPSQIARNDHPYAGWLYAGVTRQVNRSDGGFHRVGLDVGCLGPCAGGERTQKTLHNLINQALPQAWSTQLRNEAGIVLHGAWAPLRWTPARWFDLTPSLHGRFGNIFTDAGAEVMVRAGRLNLFPQQPALFGFLRGDVRAVGYNATLQGGYFSSSDARTVAPRRTVGELEAGVAWQGERFGLIASVVRRGNEMAGWPGSRGSQNFARVQLEFRP
ncbi:MAG: lipid A deacylase LpxR family protein [Lacisediminimonas sp.]|nr:lipid A deacylase LpxR family protein [Lacisediminimonas sp.]